MVASSSSDILQGTLDLLILRTLETGPRHGWAIGQRIQELSRDALRVGQGSLYPALHRLEQKGWIRARWGVTDNNRKAKYYRLTSRGQRALGDEVMNWRRFAQAVDLVLAGG